MLLLDGVYAVDDYGKMRFHRTKAPELKELTKLVHTISLRVARFLERRGLLERDEEDRYLTLDCLDEEPMQQLHGHAITYRIALGPQQGRKVFTLQTIPQSNAGSSLSTRVATEAFQRDKLERLCRYIARPAVSENRLAVLSNGNIRYQLKTPYRDGTTHVIFEPLDFVAKLAALIPKPRVNLTRFHGVFAPNSKWREKVTPAKRGKTKKLPEKVDFDKSPAKRHVAITWAQRLKRVFNIDKVN
ncbi:MAG: IS91 family transposase [Gammaproteobacteria bacterium]|nr:MAG: IS91 family transposase [Gammaproteobacteria bacterium]